MKWQEWVLAWLAGLLLMTSALRPSRPPIQEESRQIAGCRVAFRTLTHPRGRATAVVLHGLAANARLMQTLGMALHEGGLDVYLIDLPGHGDNREPFSYERAEQCTALLIEQLEKEGRLRASETVLVGHSMGGSIAIRLADRFPAAATIALGTSMMMPPAKGGPPMPVEFPRRMPTNLLLITGEYDFARIGGAAQKLIAAAGGQRFDAEDFRQRRAVSHVELPRATHTSLIFDSTAFRHANVWVHKALPPETWGMSMLSVQLGVHSYFMGSLALAAMFPLAASLCARLLGATQASTISPSSPSLIGFGAWTFAGIGAVAFLFLGVPLRPIVRLFSGDYLASALMFAGILLLLTRRHWASATEANWSVRATAVGSLLGIITMLAFGVWLDWQTTDAWLNAPRWWRFVLLVPLMVPYCLAEELALGLPVSPDLRLWQRRQAQAVRLGRFLVLRAILWLAMALAVAVLRTGEILILLLGAYLAAFSIAQRAGMDAVRLRTGSAAAAAVFGAILAAWFIAAVFPLT